MSTVNRTTTAGDAWCEMLDDIRVWAVAEGYLEHAAQAVPQPTPPPLEGQA